MKYTVLRSISRANKSCTHSSATTSNTSRRPVNPTSSATLLGCRPEKPEPSTLATSTSSASGNSTRRPTPRQPTLSPSRINSNIHTYFQQKKGRPAGLPLSAGANYNARLQALSVVRLTEPVTTSEAPRFATVLATGWPHWATLPPTEEPVNTL